MSTAADERNILRFRIHAATRVLVVVAGPNGAGKSTFVQDVLQPLEITLVNPDALARALFPDAPPIAAYEAARAADLVRGDLIERGVSFCMETVFSDPEGAKVEFLRDAQQRGYTVMLIFIGLDDSDLSLGRVVRRVQKGGHDVPDDKLKSRFPRTLANLANALTFVDYAMVYDNSSGEEPYRFVAELHNGKIVRRGTTQPDWWTSLRAKP
ncbi:MAG TPA: zeta toxin family protein [Thermoanaerobaculia bacterium]|jgi:predicted ABC-type ATPase